MRTTYDAMDERRELATELAGWKAAGFMSSARATRWHRRARILARATGLPHSEVMADLNDDAQIILDSEEGSQP